MKLYTREQMIEAFNYGKKLEGFDWIGDMIDSLTPIELPSDEEIDKFAQIASSIKEEKTQGKWIAYKSVIAGAKWVIEQIKQQAIT